jgi:nucleoside-diphosphate-sugar epimerase
VKRVLVTGGSGFIGSHCLEPLLHRSFDVHAVSTRPQAGATTAVTWHAADLLDPAAASALVAEVQPSHLLHLAWIVTPGEMIMSPQNLRWTEATLSLYRAFAEGGGRRLVTSGSSYEYDWRYGYCSENVTPRAPDTVYGNCKRALNDLTDAFAATTGVSSAWARIFFLYGPREHPNRLVSSVIRSLLAGTAAKTSHGEQIRDYLHVQDVADALVLLLDSESEGAVNVGSGEAVTLKTIVQRIGEQLGQPQLIEIGALPARANDAPLVVADVRRLKEELGWAPSFDLETGLAHTIEWWRLNEEAVA